VRATPSPQGEAMYVANQLTSSWLLNVQRTLFARSKDNLDYVFCKLWGLVVDLRNLQIALARVAGNRGHRTAGVDGVTVRMIARDGIEGFLEGVRSELRSGDYLPSPVRRVLIPKPGQLGKFRALGIPTVKDRVVQAALKNILEPVFEADFYPSSYGFRPGRSAHGALEQLRLYLRPCKAGSGDHRRLTYQWAIQGDIKACFDRIDHHALMEQVRRRVGDPKVNRLVLSFLKAGIVSEQQFVRSDAGTPQGGILSPLLANIALAVLDERYERWVWPRRSVRPAQAAKPFEASSILAAAKYARRTDRLRRKTPVLVSVRYADDFIILVAAPTGPEQFERARDVAIKEKSRTGGHAEEQARVGALGREDACHTCDRADALPRAPCLCATSSRDPRDGQHVGHPETRQPSTARTDQGLVSCLHEVEVLGRPLAQAQLAPAGVEQLLPSRVGCEEGVCLHRSLRVVDNLEVAPQEASPRTGGDAGKTIRTAGTARRYDMGG
jgi:group II intron reverse transcriptase/maturase